MLLAVAGDACAAFHDVGFAQRPCGSKWPTVARAAALFVRWLHVTCPAAGVSEPSDWDPVRTSGRVGVSPRPFTVSAFAVRMLCLVRVAPSPCSWATLWAIRTPFALYHGPVPIRSRALTASCPVTAAVLRYACQVLPATPAASANRRQCRSAPSSPPSFAPSPGPALVRKKLVRFPCADAGAAPIATANTAQTMRFVLGMMAIRSRVLWKNGTGGRRPSPARDCYLT